MITVHSAIDGQYRDIIRRNHGRIRDYGWRSNIIVDQGRVLLAAFMAGQTVTGVNRIELGRGNPDWDTQSSPLTAPSPQTDSLVDGEPVGLSIDPGNITFIDTEGNAVSEATHTVEVAVTITVDDLSTWSEPWALREFALFGQIGDDRLMIDYVRHPALALTADGELSRRIRLAF